MDGQRPIVEVAREYGLNDTTVGNWVSHPLRCGRSK
ncbi:hypothetical protein [Mycobacterium antarcticum]